MTVAFADELPDWAKRERLYTLSELIDRKENRLPIRVSRRTILGYVRQGLKNPFSGEYVRLQVIRVGRNYYTSVERFYEFLAECNL